MKKDLFTTYEAAKLCKVDISTIKNWVDDGKLHAYKTPGRHRRIKREDLILFLKKYRMPIPPQLKNEKLKILIVDDEKNIVRIITRVLKKQNWDIKIEPAYDGYEAGAKVANFFPDLLILDIKLPGIDGYKVLKDIKSNKLLKDTRILAISGNGVTETRKRILESGADIFMVKPFDLNEFVSKVAKLLDLSKT